MKLATEIISYLALVFTVIATFCKNKDKSMLFITIYNLLILSTYFLLGKISGSIMTIIASARSITFFIFAKKQIKINILVFIIFEIASIVGMIFTWDSYLSIILLLNLIITTFTSWQNNMTVLRIGFLISGILLILYDIFIGAYILLISEGIFTLSTILSIIKHDIMPRIKKKKIEEENLNE